MSALEQVFEIRSEDEMLALGTKLIGTFTVGEVVGFHGNLGAGKTTLIRGMLRGLGWKDSVRSPTFNLFAIYDTEPRVLHADFYRLTDAQGTGVEDYLDTYLCLVEWPKALESLVDLDAQAKIEIEIQGESRLVRVTYSA
jgi:tRNA threonylcarbamoyladenosine biosynthesis protein TsaE